MVRARPRVILNALPEAAAIDEQRGELHPQRAELHDGLDDLTDDLDGIEPAEPFGRPGTQVHAVPNFDDGLISEVAAAAHVNAHDQLGALDVGAVAQRGLDDIFGGDELHIGLVGEDPADADLEEVAVLAPERRPFSVQGFVSYLDGAAIDRPAPFWRQRVAAVVFFVEGPGVLRRVAEIEHHRLSVSQSAAANLENLRWHTARFIEDVEGGCRRGVLPREGF